MLPSGIDNNMEMYDVHNKTSLNKNKAETVLESANHQNTTTTNSNNSEESNSQQTNNKLNKEQELKTIIDNYDVPEYPKKFAGYGKIN